MKLLKDRFDTLSDAIIAIVMTILVLEISIPSSMKGLPHLFEQVALFLLSFIIIINFWYRRFQAMRATDKTTFRTFLMDVIAHAILALFPLATKMLVEFDVRWVGILFFGGINLLTGVLVNCMTYELAMKAVQNSPDKDEEAIQMFNDWLNRRAIGSLVADIVLLAISLCFNTIGVYIYILMPLLKFISNFRHGRAMETAYQEGQSFQEILKQRMSADKNHSASSSN